jgi:hypothetical protein
LLLGHLLLPLHYLCRVLGGDGLDCLLPTVGYLLIFGVLLYRGMRKHLVETSAAIAAANPGQPTPAPTVHENPAHGVEYAGGESVRTREPQSGKAGG